MAYNSFDNYYHDENGNIHRDIPLGTSPLDAFARNNQRMKEEIKRIDNRIDGSNDNIKTEIERLESDICDSSAAAKSQLDTAIDNINKNINTLTDCMTSDIAGINSKIDHTVNTVNSSINMEISKINHRVDNIIANSPDTEGNSELIDIRTSSDGTVYESAGTAVRNQISELEADVYRNNLINGMDYILIH
ncbi:MAG: hypothetical protein IJ192_04305, partial [Clostridia bacterium]|nr:hypothetical protein [Clostridia bacterium]